MASRRSVAYECVVMLRTSQRSHVSALENALSRALAERRARGAAIVDLTSSNVAELGLGLTDAAFSAAFSGVSASHYAPLPFGDLTARAAVAAWLTQRGPEVAGAEVMLTSSTSEAYAYLFKLLCDPGDEVLVPQPSYPLFEMLAQLEGVRAVPYPLHFDGEWQIDTHALRAACGPRTRALIAVHPNNPTGSFVKRAELHALAELDLPIISDEVFSDYLVDHTAYDVRTCAELGPERLVFRLGGLSKTLFAPQLKLAWTALSGPPAEVARARARLEHIADTFLSPNALVQAALPALLAHAPSLLRHAHARIRLNLGALREALRGSAASVFPAEGGAMAIVRLPAVMPEEELCIALLEREGVLSQPGFFYDIALGATCVLGLWSTPHDFSEGARRLRRFVDTLAEDSRS